MSACPRRRRKSSARMASMRHAILGVGGVGGLIGACLREIGRVGHRRGQGGSADAISRTTSSGKRVWKFQCACRAQRRSSALRCPVDRREGNSTGARHWRLSRKPQAVSAIVPLLNGIDHLAVLRARYGAERVIAATIAVETERVAPGHIVHRTPFARLNVSSAGRPLLGVDASKHFRRWVSSAGSSTTSQL